MTYLWWGRSESAAWDEKAVRAYNEMLDALRPALAGLVIKQWGILATNPARFSSLRKRQLKGEAFATYRVAVGENAGSVDFSLSSGDLVNGPPEFYSELYWTTGREVAGGYPFRPPNNARALGFATVVIERELLASSLGSVSFDLAMARFAESLGRHRGGTLIDRPWHHDPTDTNGFGQAGPTGARGNLLAIAPKRDSDSDLDTWSPPFDLPL
jgi:hypothetical protein